MPSNSNTREAPQIEPGVDPANADVANKSTVGAGDSLRLHLPEYAMEAGETSTRKSVWRGNTDLKPVSRGARMRWRRTRPSHRPSPRYTTS
jgi:hypothetical protein